MQEYQKLVSKVRELQESFELRREMKDSDALTRGGFRQILREELAAINPPLPAARTDTCIAASVTAATGAVANSMADAATTAANTGTTAPQQPKESHAEAARKNAEEKGCFCYVQNTSLTTISDIWKEYKEGINGGVSLEWLEANVPKWRSYSLGNTAFSRRRGIYMRMEQLIEGGLTEENAVQQLQAMLDAHQLENNKLDLKGFSSKLKKDFNLKPKPKEKNRKRKRKEDATSGNVRVEVTDV